MPTIFSKIIAGEIPCHRVLEDDAHLAFLDIAPLREGHTLVIPKREVDYIFDMDDVELAALHCFSKKVAVLLKSKIACTRIGMSVIGLEVPHAHIHLIPMDNVSDMNFARPKLNLTQARLAEIAAMISA